MFDLSCINLNLTDQKQDAVHYIETLIVVQNAQQSQDAENSALSENQRRPAPWTGREGQVGFIFSILVLQSIIILLNKPTASKVSQFRGFSVFFC